MKRYFISISEPSDFQSPDGENIIYGRILKILDYKYIVFRTDHFVKKNGVSNNILILSPRYDGDFYSMYHNKRIDINAGLYKGEYKEGLSNSELIDNCDFVIMGSINSTANWLL